jgi:hypothetical protein
MTYMIDLPNGGQFDARDLIAYIEESGRDYIIQGQQSSSRENHSKQLSLDYWLRQFAENENTKQAENSVLTALVETGLFEVVDDLECPETGWLCKGIRLVRPG